MWGDIAISFLLAFIVSFMATPESIKGIEKKLMLWYYIKRIMTKK